MDISGTVFTFESPPPAATAMEIEAAMILSGNWVVASTACPFRRANHLLEPALEMDHDWHPLPEVVHLTTSYQLRQGD